MISMMLLGVQSGAVLDHLDVGIERLDRLPRRLSLRLTDSLGVVDHLALQIRLVDLVVVDQAERADSGRGQVEGGGGAQTAGADQQHLRVQHLELAFDADLRQERVARVAHPLFGAHALGHDDREALGLPCHDAPANRGGVLVAELAELIGRTGGAVAGARSRGARAGSGRGRPLRCGRRHRPGEPARRPRYGPPCTRWARACRPAQRRPASAHRGPRRDRPPRSSA